MRILYILLLFINVIQAQNIQKVHVHNDYDQEIPFWMSVSANVDALEVDILLNNNELYVAHERSTIKKEKTLESLYLKPLKEAIKSKFVASKKPLQILIDIKTEAYATLEVLIKQLNKYPTIINNKNIKIVISGSRPKAKDYSNYPFYILFDFQEEDFPQSSSILSKIGLVSYDFKEFSVWNGKGKIVEPEYKKLKKRIAKVHDINKPIRFWATPDSKSSWKALSDLKIDFINTDHPFKCTNYLKTLPRRVFTNTVFSKVYQPTFKSDKSTQKVKNIILMIGDGNGLTQISSAVLANGGELTLTKLRSSGLMKTQSSDDFTTDSAASATAIATGFKTNNRSIGVDSKGNTIQNITEILSNNKYTSGFITTDAVFGATPSAFYAHQKDRGFEDKIAKELLTSKISLFVGGGGKKYNSKELKSHGFKIFSSVDKIDEEDKSDKIGCFLSKGGVPSVLEGRKNELAEATRKSIQFLENKSKPFFLMVEGAQIDSYGHHNDIAGVVTETIDFDRAVTEAIKFADTNKETLVIVLADHETGGLAIAQGNLNKKQIEGEFITHDHTGVLVPVFAYGPKSYEFEGCYENNEVFFKIMKILNIKN